MKKPAIPHDEENRIKSLRSLRILDTPSDERFDRLTRLAQHMFDVPITLISLVDENRQWFKSCIGLPVNETYRDISFCGHAILDDEIFIIPDATQDIRFADNPLVVNSPNIRFYAGCPLRNLDNLKLGTLCIIDTKPRTMTDADIDALKDLAELAERELMAVQLAALDDLTRIANRRGFITMAQNNLDICSREAMPASLAFFDLEDFKMINDQFGHTEGDKALKAFADLMRTEFRNEDVFARLDGDEFVVLLTNSSTVAAKEIVSRFRESLNLYNKENTRGYDITFCDEIITVDGEQNPSIERLLSRTDTVTDEEKRERFNGYNKLMAN